MSGTGPGNYSPRITKSAPDKGSFPIDHDHTCGGFMLQLLKCLRENKFDNESCRSHSKDYLKCRMDNNLMAREDMGNLGFSVSEED